MTTMKSMITALILMTTLGTANSAILANSNLQYAQAQCTTVASDTEYAITQGFTKSLELTGTALSQFVDAWLKIVGGDRADLIKFDTAMIRTNPGTADSPVFMVVFNEGCFVGVQQFAEEDIERVFKEVADMRAAQ